VCITASRLCLEFLACSPEKVSCSKGGLPMVGSHGLSVSAVSEPASGCENRRMAPKWAHGRSGVRVFRGVHTGHLPSRGGHAWATMAGQSAKGMARWDSAYDPMASSLAVCLVHSRGVRVPYVHLFSPHIARGEVDEHPLQPVTCLGTPQGTFCHSRPQGRVCRHAHSMH
jgi:hypothetical protein